MIDIGAKINTIKVKINKVVMRIPAREFKNSSVLSELFSFS